MGLETMRDCNGRRLLSVAAALVTLLIVLARVIKLGPPMVFADEFGYAAWAAALHGDLPPPLEMAAAINNWLYLRIYGLAYLGTGSFLASARVFNAMFAALAAATLVPMLASYPDSRQQRVIGFALAMGFAVAIVGGYAAYFMPESPYFSLVCLLGLAAWGYGKQPVAWIAVAAGIAGGMATMMKSHGMLLLPGTLLAIGVCGWAGGMPARRIVLHAGACALAWLAATTLLAVTLGLDAGFNPIGKFYMDMAGISTTNASSTGIEPVLQVIARHLAVLVTTLGLPLIVCTYLAWNLVSKRASELRPLAVVATLLVSSLAGMILVTSVFSVGISGTTVSETLGRLHGRYYEHLSMLAACVGIAASGLVVGAWSSRTRLATAIALVVAVVAALLLLWPVGWQNPNDFVSVFAMFASPTGRWLAALLPLGAALGALRWPKLAGTWLGAGLLLWLVYSVAVLDGLWLRRPLLPIDRAASMLAGIEAGNDRSRVMVVATPAEAYRAAFHLSEEDAVIFFPEMHPACEAMVRPEWVITVAPAADPCPGTEVMRIDDVVVSHVR